MDLDSACSFTWNYGNEFFLESSEGNYTWSSPDYHGGTNEIKKFNGTYKEWCEQNNIPFGRDKGHHKIRDYCGDKVIFI
jgi:hypothetical protein